MKIIKYITRISTIKTDITNSNKLEVFNKLPDKIDILINNGVLDWLKYRAN